MIVDNGTLSPGVVIHLTSTKKMKNEKAKVAKHWQKRPCTDCKKYKAKFICFMCHYDNDTELDLSY